MAFNHGYQQIHGDFEFKDVFEFQKKFKKKKEREEKLKKMSDEEIWHLALSCGTPQGGAYYASFMKDPYKFRKKE